MRPMSCVCRYEPSLFNPHVFGGLSCLGGTVVAHTWTPSDPFRLAAVLLAGLLFQTDCFLLPFSGHHSKEVSGHHCE